MVAVINFYRVHEEYGEFSNFAPYPLEIGGKRWPTSEHYFQSQKFAGTPDEEEIRLAATPTLAARIGRDRNRPLRPDWERVKEDVMRAALQAKFTQHAALRERLLATGDALLVEHTKNDAYWGDGGDGTGLNRLGKLLMALRQELKEEAPVQQSDF